MNEPIAYLNGRFVPYPSVALSPTDAGFVQGSAVAEQMRTFGGKIFRLADHLTRLGHSLGIVGVDTGIPGEQLSQAACEVVAHNHRLVDPDDDLGVSLFVTPGEYPAYGPPGPRKPVVCLHTYPLPFRLWAAKYRSGQSLRTTAVEQVPAQCWPPSLKCRSRMHYYLADRQAAAAEPDARALLLDHAGHVTEASTANLLIEQEGRLAMPPHDRVLPGISQAEILELAARQGIGSVQQELRLNDVASADEVFLSSTPFCLLPVTRLNGHPVGSGEPGAMFGRLVAAWNEHVGLDIVAQAERFADEASRRRSSGPGGQRLQQWGGTRAG